MNKNLTDITILLDRSGSMESVRKDTIGGFNTFLKAQKELEGEAVLTLVQFDDQYEVCYSAVPIKEVKELTTETFVPRGWTALLDAIGKTISSTGERLAKMSEKDRPEQVIFVILTDGDENYSKEYTKSVVNEAIKIQTNTYNWDFVFLGANQDAIKVGGSYGILKGNSMSFAANSQGTMDSFAAVSSSIGSYRSGNTTMKTQFFSDEDRAKQVLQ